MSEAIAAAAYNATKPKEDPEWPSVERDHRERLTYQAERAIETKHTPTEFDQKVLEIHGKESAKAEKAAAKEAEAGPNPEAGKKK